MSADRLLLVGVFSLLLTGCAMRPRPHAVLSAQAEDCALTRFPTDTRIASSSVDTFAGVYRRGDAALAVQRQDYRLLVGTPGSAAREARMVGEWRFQDGCGAIYQFSMPMNGVGSIPNIICADGAVSDWRSDSA